MKEEIEKAKTEIRGLIERLTAVNLKYFVEGPVTLQGNTRSWGKTTELGRKGRAFHVIGVIQSLNTALVELQQITFEEAVQP